MIVASDSLITKRTHLQPNISAYLGIEGIQSLIWDKNINSIKQIISQSNLRFIESWIVLRMSSKFKFVQFVHTSFEFSIKTQSYLWQFTNSRDCREMKLVKFPDLSCLKERLKERLFVSNFLHFRDFSDFSRDF